MSGREEVRTRTSSSGERKHMTYANTTTEYRIPPSKGESRKMFALLRQVAKLLGVYDKKTRDQRMKGWLIKQGWIKESRKELDHFQVQEVIRRYQNFIEPNKEHD